MIGRLTLAVTLALVPILLILRYFHTRDVHPEPRRVLRVTFALGVASVIPAILLEFLSGWPELPFPSVMLAALYTAFLGAAIPEEALKLAVVRGYCARQSSFDEPMDGVVYGVTAALGFAALENVFFVWRAGWTTAVLRAFTAVPLHAATGAMIGHAVAQARFDLSGRSAIFRGFLGAVVVHGLYDFGLIAIALRADLPEAPGDETNSLVALCLMLLVFAVLIGSIRWVLRTTRRLRAQQLEEESADEIAPESSD